MQRWLKRRLTWRGRGAAAEDPTADRASMARAGAYMYASAATLALIAVIPPNDRTSTSSGSSRPPSAATPSWPRC